MKSANQNRSEIASLARDLVRGRFRRADDPEDVESTPRVEDFDELRAYLGRHPKDWEADDFGRAYQSEVEIGREWADLLLG